MPDGRYKCRWATYALLAVLSNAAAQPVATYSEDAVKAAFLYRFTGYVEWPPEALEEVAQFTIAVMGAPAVAEALSELLRQRSIKNKPANLRVIRNASELGDARLLYIGKSYAGDVRRIIEEIDGQPVLVVTDENDGLDHGATVNFVPMDRRVRFEISLAAAERARLKIGADLLSVAARVRGAAQRSSSDCAWCAPIQSATVSTALCVRGQRVRSGRRERALS